MRIIRVEEGEQYLSGGDRGVERKAKAALKIRVCICGKSTGLLIFCWRGKLFSLLSHTFRHWGASLVQFQTQSELCVS